MKKKKKNIVNEILSLIFHKTNLNSLRKHAYSNILEILPPKKKKKKKKKENFQIKKSDIFHIPAQNIRCGYSLEPSWHGGSNE